MKWTKLDSGWPNNRKSETITETCLYHNILGQAVALNGPTLFLSRESAGLKWYKERWTLFSAWMLGAHTQSKLMDSVELMSSF